MYLALYSPEGLVIFDHPYNAEYVPEGLQTMLAQPRGAGCAPASCPSPFTPERPAPMPEEPPRVVCTAIMRAAAASSKLR